MQLQIVIADHEEALMNLNNDKLKMKQQNQMLESNIHSLEMTQAEYERVREELELNKGSLSELHAQMVNLATL